MSGVAMSRGGNIQMEQAEGTRAASVRAELEAPLRPDEDVSTAGAGGEVLPGTSEWSPPGSAGEQQPGLSAGNQGWELGRADELTTRSWRGLETRQCVGAGGRL